jgi:Flp pilus assembly protein TadG
MIIKLPYKTRTNRSQVRPGVKRMAAGNRRGQSLVEFSVAMPLLLVTVTGMLSFGLAMHNYLVLTNGVSVGAQTLAMSRGQTTDPCATAVAAVEASAPSLTPGSLSFTIVINGTSYTSTSCTSGATNMVQGTTAQITASYPCTFAIYGMSGGTCGLQTQSSEMIQ